MHRKWQVGRGNTSWDVNIAELKNKGFPRFDLAMELPDFGETFFPSVFVLDKKASLIS